MSPVALATWHTWPQKRCQLKVEQSCNHLLEHDLVGTLDEVLPDRLGDLRGAVDEMISPEHVHGSHVVDGGKLLRQASVTVKKLRMTANSRLTSGINFKSIKE